MTNLDPGIYATKVRIAAGRAQRPAEGDLLLVSGSETGQQSEPLVALGGDGKALWTTKFSDAIAESQALTISPDGAVAALAFQAGRVCVVEVSSGRIVGQIGNLGFLPQVARVARAHRAGNLLLVAAQNTISAFQLKPPVSRKVNRP